ncbi:ATP phosphoribosyltransferase regulatory subunit, divergent variant [hydrothermal vent metagenome]|uniref:ATP phosphoribosyltransferase regulatory subunit, divergent variant n=1 Tax=hydrothermal vent metagenome TaxID=652676 RepID=A0A1W1EJX5_9ZZZZ
MLFEHEIPKGSKLYFGKSAKLKREIENHASNILNKLGYEEIVTPFFSYHQAQSIADSRSLVRVSDENNSQISLRADSTVDLVRIVTKRIGRVVNHKKWFYIQPVLNFPTKEQYQIGAEIIDGSFEEIANTTIDMFKELNISPILQIANIKIPEILYNEYNIDYDVIKFMNMEKILELKIDWLLDLAKIHRVEDLKSIKGIPTNIKDELDKMFEVANKIDYDNIVISPLYYAKMRYYNSLTFRVFEGNELLARGGAYNVDDIKAVGFTLYTDECITNIMNKGN